MDENTTNELRLTEFENQVTGVSKAFDTPMPDNTSHELDDLKKQLAVLTSENADLKNQLATATVNMQALVDLANESKPLSEELGTEEDAQGPIDQGSMIPVETPGLRCEHGVFKGNPCHACQLAAKQ